MTFSFDIEIYDCTIHVLNNVTGAEYDSYMKVYFNEIPDRTSSSGAMWTIQDRTGKEHYVIDFQKRLRKDGASINIIVHESLHVAFAIAEKIMMPYSIENDEPFCYLCGYIVEKIYKGVF
jgi:hypothetical protein